MQKITVYVTKHSISNKGIIKKVEAKRLTSRPDFVEHKGENRLLSIFKLGVDCFLTEEEAIKDFNKRKEDTLIRLNQGVKRCEKLNYRFE